MFSRPILFYSDFCLHSKKFVNNLMKNHELFEAFVRINIDVDPNTNTRPPIFYDIQQQLNVRITEVPTVITPGPEMILVGADAFDWLSENVSNRSNEEISGFNSMEMGSFSDSYSTYGSNDLYDAKEQTFKFINKMDESIDTPPEDTSINKEDYESRVRNREMFDGNVDYKNNQGFGNTNKQGFGNTNKQGFGNTNKQGFGNTNKQGFGNTNKQGFGNTNKQGFGNKKYNISDKQKEIDDRLQMMIAERERFGKGIERK